MIAEVVWAGPQDRARSLQVEEVYQAATFSSYFKQVQSRSLKVQAIAVPTKHPGPFLSKWRSFAQTPFNVAVRSSFVARTESVEQVVQMLKTAGLNDAADRIEILATFQAQDPNEEPLVLESVKAAAQFLHAVSDLPRPSISTAGGGLLSYKWSLPSQGHIGLLFDRDGEIMFAAVGNSEERDFADPETKDEIANELRRYFGQHHI